MLGPELLFEGVSKLGAFVRGGADGRSSGTPKDIISTMLDTSLAIFSGRLGGSCFPTSLRLQRYMARANSGNRSRPDLVVSERTLESLAARLGAEIINLLPYLHQVAPRKLRAHK